MKNRFKHNKKRNTAILFEVLLRAATKAAMAKDLDNRDKWLNLIKSKFATKTTLGKELKLYRALYEAKDISKTTANRLLETVKREHDKLDKDKLFAEQTEVLKLITVEALDGMFIPNYKTLASIAQIFYDKSNSIKERVILEESVIRQLSSPADKAKQLEPIDKLSFKLFLERFNKSYGKSLCERQKQLLTNYVLSFTDNGLSLKLYLNEEIGKLKEEVVKAKECKEIIEDSLMLEKTDKVISLIESMKASANLSEEIIKQLLKIQEFVEEAKK